MLQLCLNICGLVSLHFDLQTPRVVQPTPLPVFLDSALFSKSSPLSQILGETCFSQGSPAGTSHQHLGSRPSVQRLRSSCPAHTKAWSPLMASSPQPGLRARFPFPPVMGRKTEVQRAQRRFHKGEEVKDQSNEADRGAGDGSFYIRSLFLGSGGASSPELLRLSPGVGGTEWESSAVEESEPTRPTESCGPWFSAVGIQRSLPHREKTGATTGLISLTFMSLQQVHTE